MNYSIGVRVTSHHPVGIVVSKQNGSHRSVRIDWECQRAIAGAQITMQGNSVGIDV
jgi:hypothetical protein